MIWLPQLHGFNDIILCYVSLWTQVSLHYNRIHGYSDYYYFIWHLSFDLKCLDGGTGSGDTVTPTRPWTTTAFNFANATRRSIIVEGSSHIL